MPERQGAAPSPIRLLTRTRDPFFVAGFPRLPADAMAQPVSALADGDLLGN